MLAVSRLLNDDKVKFKQERKFYYWHLRKDKTDLITTLFLVPTKNTVSSLFMFFLFSRFQLLWDQPGTVWLAMTVQYNYRYPIATLDSLMFSLGSSLQLPYPATLLALLLCTVVLYCAPTTTPGEQSELAQTEVVKQLLTISEDENCSNSDSHEVIAWFGCWFDIHHGTGGLSVRSD